MLVVVVIIIIIIVLLLIVGANVSFTQQSFTVDESENLLNLSIVLGLLNGATLERNIIVSVRINSSFVGITEPLRLAGIASYHYIFSIWKFSLGES